MQFTLPCCFKRACRKGRVCESERGECLLLYACARAVWPPATRGTRVGVHNRPSLGIGRTGAHTAVRPDTTRRRAVGGSGRGERGIAPCAEGMAKLSLPAPSLFARRASGRYRRRAVSGVAATGNWQATLRGHRWTTDGMTLKLPPLGLWKLRPLRPRPVRALHTTGGKRAQGPPPLHWAR